MTDNLEKQYNAVEVLKEARAKIERGWTQGMYARDSTGAHAADTASYAVAWCAIGACHGCCAGWAPMAVVKYLVMAIPMGFKTVSEYNDAPGRTKADILRLYDNAITMAKGDVLRGA